MDRIHIETSQKLNYADAVKFCQDRNSQLIEIDTSEQMESVAAELRRVKAASSLVPNCFHACPPPACAAECWTAWWTGGSDGGQEGDWVWTHSGTALN